MTPIDEVLARALLTPSICTPADIVPYTEPDADTLPDLDPAYDAQPDRGRASSRAARDLQTLCEATLAHSTPASVEFLTEQLPEPAGAVVLGCVLQLTDDQDSARVWWQYAAGAGLHAAAYCLHLQHLALDERDAAAWWLQWTQIDTRPVPETESRTPGAPEPLQNVDASTPTLLRVLRQLVVLADQRRSEVADALIAYVPSAVARGYIMEPQLDFEVPIDIPLPGEDFADRVSLLLAAASAIDNVPAPQPRSDEPPLPDRPAVCQKGGSMRQDDAQSCVRSGWAGG